LRLAGARRPDMAALHRFIADEKPRRVLLPNAVLQQLSALPPAAGAPRCTIITAGEQLLTRGHVLSPSRLGVCAAAGHAHVDVYARPIVAIVSTGGEIVEPGQPLRPAQIYDINRFTLSAIVEAHGGEPRVLRSAADALEELTTLLREAAAEPFLALLEEVVERGGRSAAGPALARRLAPRIARSAAAVAVSARAAAGGAPGAALILAPQCAEARAPPGCSCHETFIGSAPEEKQWQAERIGLSAGG
jgi:putative molybdopterin biosynthesis protein